MSPVFVLTSPCFHDLGLQTNLSKLLLLCCRPGLSSKADLVANTELVPADFLPNGLPVPVSSNNQSFDTVADLDRAAPLEGAPAISQPAPVSPVSDDKVVNSHPAVLTKVELLPLQHAQEDSCGASDADAPAVTDSSVVEQVGKPDAAANVDVNLPKVDTDAMAGRSAQPLATSASEDSALSFQETFQTASRVRDADETTEGTGGAVPTATAGNTEGTGGVVPIPTAGNTEGTGGVVPITTAGNTEGTGGVEPITTAGNTEATGGVVPITTVGNTEATGGVVPITTPAAEVQQAAQQQLLLAHPASAGSLDATSDMLLYNGSKQQDAYSLSAQPNQLSGPAMSATTSAADSQVDDALREISITAKPSRKEIAERPIGDLSSPDLEVIQEPEDLIPSRATDPKSFQAQPDDVMEPTESDEDSLHAMRAR